MGTHDLPGLNHGTSIVRGHILRQHAWSGGGKLSLTSKVVASSSKVLAVAMHADGKGGKRTAVVYYDPHTNASFASPALIAPDKWNDFVTLVGTTARDVTIAKELTQPSWPMGGGPALAFSADGDLVVQPQGGKKGVLIPEKKVSPMLTELGLRAKAGAQYATPTEAAAEFEATDPALVGVPAKGKDPRPTLGLGTDCTKKKCIAITFDDGPVPETQEVLDALAKEEVPATFFVLGTSVDAAPDMVTRTAAAGMELGSHNQVHNAMTSVGDERLAKQLDQSAGTIRKLAGQDPLFMRPPYGDHNKRVDAQIAKKGMSVAMWSVDTLDWKNKDTASILSKLDAQGESGGVVLMHDIHQSTRAAVPELITKLKKDGYTIVTLAEMGPDLYRPGKTFCHGPVVEKPCV